jgi:hypothetical protein
VHLTASKAVGMRLEMTSAPRRSVEGMNGATMNAATMEAAGMKTAAAMEAAATVEPATAAVAATTTVAATTATSGRLGQVWKHHCCNRACEDRGDRDRNLSSANRSCHVSSTLFDGGLKAGSNRGTLGNTRGRLSVPPARQAHVPMSILGPEARSPPGSISICRGATRAQPAACADGSVGDRPLCRALLNANPHHMLHKLVGRTAKAWPSGAFVLIGLTCFRLPRPDRP